MTQIIHNASDHIELRRCKMKGRSLREIGKILACCVFVLTLCFCFGNGRRPEPGHARKLQLFNCNHDSEALSATAYNICTSVDGINFIERGGLNPQPGNWADCQDEAHQAASITLNLIEDLDTAGKKWEIRAIKVDPSGSCNSTCPPVANACTSEAKFFQADVQASNEPLVVKFSEAGQ
jgi:hypothetical protein